MEEHRRVSVKIHCSQCEILSTTLIVVRVTVVNDWHAALSTEDEGVFHEGTAECRKAKVF